jgi:AcrR family transcriptional regulator
MGENRSSAASGSPSRSRRPVGAVRRGLIEAGVALAREGGPGAVALREATRYVGVSPNAAYRHFADRDDLLAAVCGAAMLEMASRMEAAMVQVVAPAGTPDGATARLTAIGQAYLDFAATEPGLFATAFAVPGHLAYAAAPGGAGPGGRSPLQLLQSALDDLVVTGAIPPDRRPDAEFPVWASVHGMAVLRSQGPLREVPAEQGERLGARLLSFIIRGL